MINPIQKFESMIKLAKLKALSKASLERPLSPSECEEMFLLSKECLNYG